MSETKQNKMDKADEIVLSLGERIDALIVERQGIVDEWDFGVQRWSKKLTAVLKEDLVASMRFITDECSDEQLYEISYVFEEMVQETQSVEFINCLKDRVKTVQNPRIHKELVQEIEFAEGYLDE